MKGLSLRPHLIRIKFSFIFKHRTAGSKASLLDNGNWFGKGLDVHFCLNRRKRKAGSHQSKNEDVLFC